MDTIENPDMVLILKDTDLMRQKSWKFSLVEMSSLMNHNQLWAEERGSQKKSSGRN